MVKNGIFGQKALFGTFWSQISPTRLELSKDVLYQNGESFGAKPRFALIFYIGLTQKENTPVEIWLKMEKGEYSQYSPFLKITKKALFWENTFFQIYYF